MSAHFSDTNRRVLSIVGPVGNNALQAVGIAAAVRDEPNRPIVLCSVGDGTTQQGEFSEAVAEAVRSGVPVLFLVQNNRYSISTRTKGQTFFDLPGGLPSTFMGLDIVRANAEQPQNVSDLFETIVSGMRADRLPRLCILDVERLDNHASSDDQSFYREKDEIAEGALRDPLPLVRRHLSTYQIMRLRQKRLHRRPFLIGQVARVTLRLPGGLDHPATALDCPHPRRESHLKIPVKSCQTAS